MQLTHVLRTTLSLPARIVWLAVAMLLAIAGLFPPAARGAHTTVNTAIEWNEIASTAITGPAAQGNAAQPPHVAVLSLAMVQGAVFDAVNAIEGGYQPYLVAPEADEGASVDAAVATAAFCVLVGSNVDPTDPCELPGLFPGQFATLKAKYDTSLAHVTDGKIGGVEVGVAAATAMLTERQDDGRFGTFRFIPGTEPGDWRLGPPQGPTGVVAQDPNAWVAFVDPFLVPDIEMLRTDGPNALTSEEYAKDFNEVKTLGSLTSTKRTADQTAASIFWQDNGMAIWNRVFRQLAMGRGLGVADSARLFAMTNLAGADAATGCWNDKAYHNFWRPITAIREANADGNPATVADPSWVPLFDPTVPVSPAPIAPAVVSAAPLVTPGFPDHPSGHGCVSGAVLKTMQAFFGTDKVSFTAVSNKCLPAPCPNRSFDRFSLALKEIIDARVWSGIHFRTADVQGSVLGKKVSHYLVKNYFNPLA
jgi:hypothetical protein